MRVATALLIVLTGVTIGHAQQLELRPFYPQKEKTPDRLFPTSPLDSSAPSLPLPRTQGPGTPQSAAPRRVTPERSGSVCLKEIPVDRSIDRGLAVPVVPDTRRLPMRTVEMPPCVTLAPQRAR